MSSVCSLTDRVIVYRLCNFQTCRKQVLALSDRSSFTYQIPCLSGLSTTTKIIDIAVIPSQTLQSSSVIISKFQTEESELLVYSEFPQSLLLIIRFLRQPLPHLCSKDQASYCNLFFCVPNVTLPTTTIYNTVPKALVFCCRIHKARNPATYRDELKTSSAQRAAEES